MFTEILLRFRLFADSTLTSFTNDQVSEKCGVAGFDFFGFPPWYKYLRTNVDAAGNPIDCGPVIEGINDLWFIALAVVEILLRVAVLVAIGYVLFGGFKYVTARGQAEKLNSAKLTVYDALTGLVIAIVAIAIVSYLASRFTQSGPGS